MDEVVVEEYKTEAGGYGTFVVRLEGYVWKTITQASVPEVDAVIAIIDGQRVDLRKRVLPNLLDAMKEAIKSQWYMDKMHRREAAGERA